MRLNARVFHYCSEGDVAASDATRCVAECRMSCVAEITTRATLQYANEEKKRTFTRSNIA